MTDELKRAAAIDAVARQREGGEPSEYGTREATRFVDDLLAAWSHLPHLTTNAEPPEVLESRTGERVVTYDLRKVDDA